jgi:ketosteroid isomerase-like protein
VPECLDQDRVTTADEWLGGRAWTTIAGRYDWQVGDTDQRIATLRRAYEFLNDGNLDGLVELLDPDVEWPDITGGSAVHGRAAFRRYWANALSVASPRIVPRDFLIDGDSVIAVLERQIFDLEGRSLGPLAVVVHRVEFRGAFIVRIAITTSDLETPKRVLEMFHRAESAVPREG